MLQLLAQADDFGYSTTVDNIDPNAVAGVAAVFGGFFILMMLVLLVLGIFTIWMLIDAILRQDNEYPNSSGKVMWILLILFIGFIPAIIYFFMVKKQIPRNGGNTPPKNTPPPVDNVPPPVK